MPWAKVLMKCLNCKKKFMGGSRRKFCSIACVSESNSLRLHRQYKNDEKFRAHVLKIGEAARNTDEWLKAVHKVRKESWADDEYREKVSKKISESVKENYEKHPEIRVKLSIAAKGKKRSPEAIRKSSEGIRRAIVSGSYRPKFNGFGVSEKGWIDTEKGGKFFYMSSWEKLFAELMDACSLVKRLEYEPFQISYRFEKKCRSYFPDFLIELIDGRCLVVELKPPCYHSDKKVLEKLRAAKKFCEKRDMRFVLLGDWMSPISKWAA